MDDRCAGGNDLHVLELAQSTQQKSNPVVAVIFVVAVVAFVWWAFFTDGGRAARKRGAEQRAAKRARNRTPLSQLGAKSAEGGGGLACPKCGGTQFKVQRKTSTKLALGAASMLGQARWARCVTCGERYRRG